MNDRIQYNEYVVNILKYDGLVLLHQVIRSHSAEYLSMHSQLVTASQNDLAKPL